MSVRISSSIISVDFRTRLRFFSAIRRLAVFEFITGFIRNEVAYKIYPYHFVIQVQYELSEKTVKITDRVQNLSDDRIYFGIGGHPGLILKFLEYYN